VKEERLSPVRGAFHRQGARCSFSPLSGGDCASCNPLARAPGCPGPASRGARTHPANRCSALRHLRLLPPRVASQWEASSGAHASRDVTLPRDCHPKARPPFTSTPAPSPGLTPARSCVGEQGFCGPSRLSTSATRTRRTSTSTRSLPRAPWTCVPLRSRRSPGVCAPCPPPSEDEDSATCATRHPCTTRDGFASDRPHRAFARRRPRYMSGPAVLKRRARSLLGFLRACLLRRQPSIPLSPTRCHGGLELLRRASRGPSRPISRVERDRVRQHELAKVFVPAPSREGWRFPGDQGAFRRSSPPGLEGRPSPLRVGLSVTPPALGWVRALRSGDQRLCYCGPSASP